MRTYLVISLVCICAGAAQAADIERGRTIANTQCITCHGKTGISSNPMYPNLAGQQAPYMAKQLQDFKSGKRSDPVMGAMVKSLSDSDIESLALWYNSLK